MTHPFGNRLKLLRKKRGFTMEKLGAAVGVAKTTISGYENGNREPPLAVITKLAHALRTTADYLLGITDAEEQPFLSPTADASAEAPFFHWNGAELDEQELRTIRDFIASIVAKNKRRTSEERSS
ncbi:helix-turn-helix transcriptional regulator [Cohnella ginsengisoli]|uniref:Helix-turn-helix transcriptional regulator n=1 Tax=Cohnella ginsengisoli TaxID=425004 RepID=A0A9X4KI88_9BACL|nr:helix-turn-helix transcriptional regulator [Cohnella ginsengisoli]MDG0792478.1 helix-turn-helix transcriptional regulator [Cohnella ginsengisoli]